MGTLITTIIISLIIVPLVLGSIFKGALVGRRMLKKGAEPASPGKAAEKDGVFRSLGPWAASWAVGILLFVVLAGVSAYTQVEAGTVGVVKRLGQVQGTVFEPGFHFKFPFLDQVVFYSTKVTSYEASEDPSGSLANYTDFVVDSTTSDGQTVQLTFTVLFRIPVEAAAGVAQEVGNMDAVVENVIKAFARSVSREVPKGFSAEALYTQKGQVDAQDSIQARLEEAFSRHGVIIDQYLIRRITFAPDYVVAVEAKQIAKQNALTEENNIAKQEAIKKQTIINAEGEAEKKKIEAAGEAEAIRLKQEALVQNPLIIQYEFVQRLSPNIEWGILPDSIVPLIDVKGMTGTTP
ncbi:MAG TPA: prohibitin family protein [Thermoleophilia bacterium]|nr:prohibitin family protein [Thermoleophilia bacterium]